MRGKETVRTSIVSNDSVPPSSAGCLFLRQHSSHVVMFDMASGSLSRSVNGKARRSLHKLNGKAPKSSADSMEDTSRESSEVSSVSTPLRKVSRKQPASEPLDFAARKKKKSNRLKKECQHLSTPSVASDPASPESPLQERSCAATELLSISQPDISDVKTRSKLKKKKPVQSSEPTTRKAELTANVILQQLKDGIDSNDTDTIFHILDENNAKLVNATVDQLPIEFVSRLLEFLKKKICRKTVKTANSVLWLEQLLHSKLTFLLSLPRANTTIEPLSEALNTRIEVFDRVLKLKGRLNILVSQSCDNAPKTNLSSKAAVAQFEDSSDDEVEQRFVMGSFPTNQLNQKGLREDRSEDELQEEMDGLDASPGAERDIDCD